MALWILFKDDILYLFSLGRFTQEEKELNKKFLNSLTGPMENFTPQQNYSRTAILSNVALLNNFTLPMKAFIFDYTQLWRKEWDGNLKLLEKKK